MRSLLLVLVMAVLSGCASSQNADKTGNKDAAKAPPILEKLRLTLDLRYPMGQTLSMQTRVSVVCEEQLVSTTLDKCGMTPGTNYVRFTTGGIVHPNTTCHVLITPPEEPTQVFDIEIPRRPRELGVWSEWQSPTNQIVSPMPVQALRTQPKARQKLTIPPARWYGIRHQLTPWNARDPKTD